MKLNYNILNNVVNYQVIPFDPTEPFVRIDDSLFIQYENKPEAISQIILWILNEQEIDHQILERL